MPLLDTFIESSVETTQDAIADACGRIPPLWPLQNFVAVNPFLGLTDRTFPDAARLIEAAGHSGILMDAEFYRNQWSKRRIADEEIAAAYTAFTGLPAPHHPAAWLNAELDRGERTHQVLTVADWLDYTQDTNWAGFVVDEISKWCSSYFDVGQSQWEMPWRNEPLYPAWKRAAGIDRNPEVFGLRGFRAFVRALPEDEDSALEQMLAALNLPKAEVADFLHRQLMSVFGWSAWAAFRQRNAPQQNMVRQVLAIRLAYDVALFGVADGFQITRRAPAAGSFTTAKYVAQIALEATFRNTLARRLEKSRASVGGHRRKRLHAVFCIDVRSEAYRRALEAQADGIDTIGFAGFFGMPLDVDGAARCPVLIGPNCEVQSEKSESPLNLGTMAVARLRTSASACFSFVETAGLSYGLQLLKSSFGWIDTRVQSPKLVWRIPLEARVQLVAGALRNMSIDPRTLAPVVLICGHGSKTENNPYGSSLDCGACGGHQGDVNARFAAALMNDPEVREQLRREGVEIPDDTVFVAALHVTTTNEVVVYDPQGLTTSQINELQGWLRGASAMLASDGVRRSKDWSEVRPEWGLAGNAAFIAAPRWRTRDLDLGGRAFLHDYDATADADGSVLTLILTAPVVVASWINLQYFGSTVNNELFGSGNKVLHNVVGKFGVWEGNAGDLKTGLPLQSLHDGLSWVHEPLRLQVFVEAPALRIDAVLQAHPHVAQLVENEWIRLIAIEGNLFRQRTPDGLWRSLSA